MTAPDRDGRAEAPARHRLGALLMRAVQWPILRPALTRITRRSGHGQEQSETTPTPLPTGAAQP